MMGKKLDALFIHAIDFITIALAVMILCGAGVRVHAAFVLGVM